MKRYIDADAFRHRILCQPKKMSVNEVLELVSTMPTADVLENVHAKFVSEIIKREDWKGRTQSYYQSNSCSNCHTALTGKENYCPNCGAEMSKGEDNDKKRS